MKAVVVKKPTAEETRRAAFYKTVKDLGSSELEFRLGLSATAMEKTRKRHALLLGKLQENKTRSYFATMHHAVVLEILESRR